MAEASGHGTAIESVIALWRLTSIAVASAHLASLWWIAEEQSTPSWLATRRNAGREGGESRGPVPSRHRCRSRNVTTLAASNDRLWSPVCHSPPRLSTPIKWPSADYKLAPTWFFERPAGAGMWVCNRRKYIGSWHHHPCIRQNSRVRGENARRRLEIRWAAAGGGSDEMTPMPAA